MKFAMTSPDGGWLTWSDDPDDLVDGKPLVLGDEALLYRIGRLILLGREVGHLRHTFPASTDTAYAAYHTYLSVMRAHGAHGPIDFAGIDDDGLPMTFMPAPEANHLVQHLH